MRLTQAQAGPGAPLSWPRARPGWALSLPSDPLLPVSTVATHSGVCLTCKGGLHPSACFPEHQHILVSLFALLTLFSSPTKELAGLILIFICPFCAF